MNFVISNDSRYWDGCTEVTKQLTKYIKSNELQDESNVEELFPTRNLRNFLMVRVKSNLLQPSEIYEGSLPKF